MQSLKGLHDPQFVTSLRWLLALVFLVSSIGKFQDMRGFISTVLDYQVLPILWARRFAIALPWLEISIGLSLIFGLFTQIVAGLSIVLLFSFVVAMGLNLLRGRNNLDCGCGGAKHRQKISSKLLVRNSFLMLFSFQVLLSGPGILALDNRLAEMTWNTILSDVVFPMVMSLSGIFLLYRLLRQIVRLARLEYRQ